MTPAVNGTDERLDLVADLLREILAELRQANAPTVVDVTAHSTGELKPASAPKRRK